MTMIECTFEIDKLLDLLFKNEKQWSKKNNLLDKGRIVYLQIVIFKSPVIRSPRRKFLKLCHSLHGDDPEICLFVPNRRTGVPYKKSTDELIDFCVDHYTELLEKHKIKGINTVMPVKQLTAEYGTYELRTKLVQRFDLFLCKNSLLYNSRFLAGLGKIFLSANKFPLGVAFPGTENEYDPNFEKSIKRAIFASSFYIKPFSDNYSIPFGTMSHTKAQLKENLKAVLEQISSGDLIPGGSNNIKTIYIWPSQSKTIPLYVCPELPDKLPKVRVKSRRKCLSFAEGELSTLPGKKVTVMPNGEVFVTKDQSYRAKVDDDFEESDDSFHDESDEEENEEENNTKDHKPDFKKKKEEGEDETDSEDDEQIEEREQRLLRMKREAEDDSFTAPKKIKKGSDAEVPEVVVKKKNKVKKDGDAKIASKKMGKKKKKVEEKVKPKLGKKKMEKASKKPKLKQDKSKEKGKLKSKSKGNARA